MATTVEKARRDVYRAKARLKRAELRAGVQQRASAAGDAVTTLVADQIAPAVHDAFTDHVVPVVTEKVVPAVRDTFTDKVAPAVTDKVVPAVHDAFADHVVPAAQKAARKGAKRSAALSREAAARLAETDAAQDARRRAEAALTAAAAKAGGKAAKAAKKPKRRSRLVLVLGLLGGGVVMARRYAQRANNGLPAAGPAADLRVPGNSSDRTVDLTTEQQSTPSTDKTA
ncbi:MAG TPA: hypothetical protein VHE83_05935 [Mycobacteriales bacterium]|nr:hypothetical protein [Mycobacteriales bacterium]